MRRCPAKRSSRPPRTRGRADRCSSDACGVGDGVTIQLRAHWTTSGGPGDRAVSRDRRRHARRRRLRNRRRSTRQAADRPPEPRFSCVNTSTSRRAGARKLILSLQGAAGGPRQGQGARGAKGRLGARPKTGQAGPRTSLLSEEAGAGARRPGRRRPDGFSGPRAPRPSARVGTRCLPASPSAGGHRAS